MNEASSGENEDPSGVARVLLNGLIRIYSAVVNSGGSGDGGHDGFMGGGGFWHIDPIGMAKDYAAQSPTTDEAIDRLIKWQVGNASVAGFVSNLGGIITLPVAIPANLAAVLFIQLRMVAAIAHLRGYDIKSDQVRTFALACLAGSGAVDILKDVGVQMGSKLASRALMSISGATLTRINQAVGFRLVTKAGTTGLVNLSKMVPFVGGIVGGTIDGTTTKAIGSAAKAVFTALPPPDNSTQVQNVPVA
jgi:hypothetical protein